MYWLCVQWAVDLRCPFDRLLSLLQVLLRPRPAQALPSVINITTGNESVTMSDVLWGDVYGCHGQSNMAFGLGQDMNHTAECAATGQFPTIRFTTFTSNLPWSVAAPATACSGRGFSPFSAVCW